MSIQDTIKFDINITTLSPIHIGTGEYIEPFSYVLRGGKLLRYNFTDFVSSLSKSDLDSLTKLIKNSSLKKDIKIFYEEQRKVLDYIDSKFDETVVEHTAHTLKTLVTRENIAKNTNGSIKSIFYDGEKPIIPGSSIKGAVRTAILKSARSKSNPNGIKDPFKMLSISDATRIDKPIKVNYGFYDYYKRDTLELGTKTNINVFAEVIEPHNVLTTSVILKNYLSSPCVDELEKNIVLICSSKKAFLKSINDNYRELFYREITPLQVACKVNIDGSRFLRQVNAFDEAIKSDKMAVMKIGWHSGSMGVTLPGRNIKSRGVPKPEPDYFWYFSHASQRLKSDPYSLYPSGWVVLV